MLQTSSNQRNSHRLTRTPVTNVVNPSPKTAIISEKALRLTTFVTTDQKCAQKTPWIDDVCNNMHQSTPKNSTRETPVTPTGSRGTGPRCRRAVAGPGQTTSQRTEQHQRPGTTGVEGTGESGGPGCSARGRRRGLIAVPEGLEGLAATPVGSVGAWSRCRWVAAGPGRASRSTTPSRQARVWRSRGRAAAHRHTERPDRTRQIMRSGWRAYRAARPDTTRGARNTRGATQQLKPQKHNEKYPLKHQHSQLHSNTPKSHMRNMRAS